MINQKNYIEYLLHTPFNYTCTNMAEHTPNLSHDKVSDFLRQEKFTPSQLWKVVKPHLQDSESSVIIADDSVQDKRYSYFIELVKRQYSGNEHGTVRGIGLLNFVHSSGNDGDFYPINYRIYHPDTDGKTKNEYFREMFMNLVTHKQLKTNDNTIRFLVCFRRQSQTDSPTKLDFLQQPEEQSENKFEQGKRLPRAPNSCF
jgi:hypothetical protein